MPKVKFISNARTGGKRLLSSLMAVALVSSFVLSPAALALDGSAPVANDDTFSLYHMQRSYLNIGQNDEGLDDEQAQINLPSQSEHAWLYLSDENIVTYLPHSGYFEGDTFTYTITNSNGTSNQATVTINFEDTFYVNDDSLTGYEDQPLVLDPRYNDGTSVPGGVQIDSFTTPEHGTFEKNIYNLYTFTPDPNWYGQTSFDYTVSAVNAPELNGRATVTITIKPVSDAPVANNDSFTVNEDSGAFYGNVMANDSSIDGTPVAALAQQPARGTVTFNSNGDFSYTPQANFSGTDTFSYTLTYDGLTATANVSMIVTPSNDTPSAVNDTMTVNEDSTATLNVIANDTDADGDTLSFDKFVSQPSHGSVTVSGGNVTYTPQANYNGTDTFSYRVTDPSGASSVATVTVNVASVNDAPVASFDWSGRWNKEISFDANASSDIDGNIASYAWNFGDGATATGANAQHKFSHKGSFTVTLTVTDNQGATSTITKTITI